MSGINLRTRFYFKYCEGGIRTDTSMSAYRRHMCANRHIFTNYIRKRVFFLFQRNANTKQKKFTLNLKKITHLSTTKMTKEDLFSCMSSAVRSNLLDLTICRHKTCLLCLVVAKYSMKY